MENFVAELQSQFQHLQEAVVSPGFLYQVAALLAIYLFNWS